MSGGNIARRTFGKLAIIVAVLTLVVVFSPAPAAALEKVTLQLRWITSLGSPVTTRPSGRVIIKRPVWTLILCPHSSPMESFIKPRGRSPKVVPILASAALISYKPGTMELHSSWCHPYISRAQLPFTPKQGQNLIAPLT